MPVAKEWLKAPLPAGGVGLPEFFWEILFQTVLFFLFLAVILFAGNKLEIKELTGSLVKVAEGWKIKSEAKEDSIYFGTEEQLASKNIELKEVDKISVKYALIDDKNTILSSFTAKSDGKNVTLQWTTTNEASISHFEIERAPIGKTFKYLGMEKVHGFASSYTFTDDNVFNKEDGTNHSLSSNNFMYRLKIVKKDNKC